MVNGGDLSALLIPVPMRHQVVLQAHQRQFLGAIAGGDGNDTVFINFLGVYQQLQVAGNAGDDSVTLWRRR